VKRVKVIQIFSIVIVCSVLILASGGYVRSKISVPSPTPPPTPSPPDSDGDGFNDWFEVNVAGYDPNVPNDRYIILYYRMLDQPGLVPYEIDNPTKFFIEKGKVPPENIIGLAQEGANAITLKNAIEQVAEKADENDIVFLSIQTHGYTIASFSSGDENISSLIYMDKSYAMIDEWLDKINAKVVVVQILACGYERALPPLKDGPCPRIVFVPSAGEFFSALGEYQYVNPLPQGTKYEEMRMYFLKNFITVDTKYGNGDGYVSVGEIGNWIDNDPKWGPDWGELHEKGRSFVEAEGYSKMSDTSSIASKIYLTDYKNPKLVR
jgi:hypothetical protein